MFLTLTCGSYGKSARTAHRPTRTATTTSERPATRRTSPRDHLSVFVAGEPGALVFPGVKGGPLRRGNFNKMSAWPQAVKSVGAEGLHVHDLRHTGNTFAAASGAQLRDLMARMGHDSERAAMIYQHESRGADKAITDAIDRHVHTQQEDGDDEDGGAAGVLVPLANGPLMARRSLPARDQPRFAVRIMALTWADALERVRRIELPLSAWEADVLPLNYTRAGQAGHRGSAET
jgi:Phage integrase family